MSDVFRRNLFAGKTAVITGGGGSINFVIARKFAQHGAKLGLIGRRQERLDAAAAEIRKDGGTALGAAADVRDYEALEAAFKKLTGELGGIDILVCGAAGNFPAAAAKMSAHGFKSVIDIDLLGTFNAARAAFEHLRKPGAAVINISAPQASVPMAYQSHVCAGKAGVDMITRTLAIEWGPLGIRVNSVTPGPIADTEGMKRLTPTAEMAAALAKALPLQRYGEKEEIAELAMFLASDAAKYITGAVVPCDGGSCLVGSGAWAQALAGAVR
jgi:NAD(P)-dependent dehydrogenase (short-subunit alcohol dehydrogenase family)